MAKESYAPGITGRILNIKCKTLSTGADLTGVLYSDIIAYYKIQGSAPVAITLVTATQGTYTNSGGAGTGGGFIQVSSAHMPGEYELSAPTAMFASGKDVTLCIQANGGTSAGMATIDCEFQLDASCIVQYPFQKNMAFTGFQFPMTLASDHISPYTGAANTVSGKVVRDTVGYNLTNTGSIYLPTGVSVPGIYCIDLTAADLNGNMFALIFSAPGCDDTKILFALQS